MTQRDITGVLVDIIKYEYFWPDAESAGTVLEFTHSREVNGLCRDMLPPYTVTPVDKSALEEALQRYLERRGTSADDEAKIRTWLAQLPDDIAIMERGP